MPLVPKLSDLLKQRFILHQDAGLPPSEWAQMMPWERDDYMRQLIAREEEETKQRKQHEEKMKREISSLKSKKRW